MVALKPNLAPDTVSMTTLGPGENKPTNTNTINGTVSVITSFLKDSKGSSNTLAKAIVKQEG